MFCAKCKIADRQSSSYCKPCYNEYRRAWRKVNPDKCKARDRHSAAYDKRRRAADPIFRLRKLLRERLNKALRNNQKTGSAIKLLGCTVTEFMNHLQSKFKVGMTWDNRSVWHIDHIKPISSFDLSNPEELKIACHYTNMQPLWAAENLAKSNKVPQCA